MSDFDCQSCGACCCPANNAEVYVEVTPDDEVRLTPTRRLKVIDGELMTKHSRNSGVRTCVFLKGTVGDHVSCAIYTTRPSNCSKFEPGSKMCHFHRRIQGIEF